MGVRGDCWRWRLGFVTSTTFALLRRFRELVWIWVGLPCLAMLRGRDAAPSGELSEQPQPKRI